MTLVKKDLINTITKTVGLTKMESDDIVNHFFEIIKENVLKHNEVKLSGFGNFQTRHKKARPARNPKTGEYALVSERKVVTFKVSGKLRKVVQLQAEI
jgi:integration host factor subunit alpha